MRTILELRVVREIVEGLAEALGPFSIVLHDDHEARGYVLTSDGAEAARRQVQSAALQKVECHVTAPIHDRWTLTVYARRRTQLHPDAQLLTDWAAVKLSPYLPERPGAVGPFTPGGNGGPSGSAELGIPVWWARRTGN